jgi:hypothetical protein
MSTTTPDANLPDVNRELLRPQPGELIDLIRRCEEISKAIPPIFLNRSAFEELLVFTFAIWRISELLRTPSVRDRRDLDSPLAALVRSVSDSLSWYEDQVRRKAFDVPIFLSKAK